jgi:DNA-binding LacI/PurR family transcriptional regulator
MGKAIAKLYFKEARSEAEVSVPRIINIQPQLIIRDSTLKN